MQPPSYDPTDLEAIEERRTAAIQRAVIEAEERRDELRMLLRSPKGRRRLRREFREAGFNVEHDDVPTILDRHHGTMCFNEGLRVNALRLIWPLLRLVASRDIPLEHFKLLMTEGDHHDETVAGSGN